MIAPGVRVARGPNWIWNEQGDFFGIDFTFTQLFFGFQNVCVCALFSFV